MSIPEPMIPGHSTPEGEPARESPSGDSLTENLLPMVFEELRTIAARYLNRERRGHTLQPTDLVHEDYLKLAEQSSKVWRSRTHFFAVAASAVRQVLVDHARTHNRSKREGKHRRVTIQEFDAAVDGSSIDLLAMDEALTKLARLNERQSRIVELRFFGGLSVEEAAATLKLSPRTVKGEWRIARAWLYRQMKGDAEDGRGPAS